MLTSQLPFKIAGEGYSAGRHSPAGRKEQAGLFEAAQWTGQRLPHLGRLRPSWRNRTPRLHSQLQGSGESATSQAVSSQLTNGTPVPLDCPRIRLQNCSVCMFPSCLPMGDGWLSFLARILIMPQWL